ncbi:MAG: palindromic element RPE3 domain-containing protein [Rickettsia endosymbiont of Argas persicus]
MNLKTSLHLIREHRLCLQNSLGSSFLNNAVPNFEVSKV